MVFYHCNIQMTNTEDGAREWAVAAKTLTLLSFGGLWEDFRTLGKGLNAVSRA